MPTNATTQETRRRSVFSTMIAAIGYNPLTEELDVEFPNGAVYRYHGVPETEYARLMLAESIGKHFTQYVKKQYRAEKL